MKESNTKSTESLESLYGLKKEVELLTYWSLNVVFIEQ